MGKFNERSGIPHPEDVSQLVQFASVEQDVASASCEVGVIDLRTPVWV